LRLIANKKLWVALHTHNNPVSEPKINRFKKELTSEKTTLKVRSGYMYGFNGKETDKETDLQDYGMRIYNPSLGRFLSTDPISGSYPMLTPYQFASNRPIDGIDIDGLEYSPVGELWKSAGVTSSTAQATEYQTQKIMDDIQPYAKPVLTVLVGTAAIAAVIATGGAGAPVLVALGTMSGAYTFGVGLAQVQGVIAGKEEIVSKLPDSYLDATVGVIVNGVVTGQDGVSQKVRIYTHGILNFADGAITFNYGLPSTILEGADQVLSITDVIVTGAEDVSKMLEISESDGTTPFPGYQPGGPVALNDDLTNRPDATFVQQTQMTPSNSPTALDNLPMSIFFLDSESDTECNDMECNDTPSSTPSGQ
jgi:RHS repeat-associated protein